MFKGKASTVVSGGVRKSKAAVSQSKGRPAAVKSQKPSRAEALEADAMDIERFIAAQGAQDVDALLSASGVAKVSKKKRKTDVGMKATDKAADKDEEEENEDGPHTLVVKAKAGAEEDIEDMDAEELAELKAYREIQREQRKARQELRAIEKLLGGDQGAEDDDEDDEDDEDDDEEDEEEDEAQGLKSKVFRNDKPALLAKLLQIRLDAEPGSVLPWIEFQRITSSQPLDLAPADIDNDLKREMAFYKQALEAAELGYKELRKLKVSVHRPDDYYAEMVKSDEHMMRVRQKLVDEANAIAAAEKARKLRDAKKFGKKVQQEKLQEREKSKREELDKVKLLRKKASSSKNKDGEVDDEFGISVEKEYGVPTSGNQGAASAGIKAGKNGGQSAANAINHKRKAKDAKFGFGGKKRLAKQNTKESTDDISAFSVKKMKSGALGQKKGSGVGKKSQRPGKARRQQNKRK